MPHLRADAGGRVPAASKAESASEWGANRCAKISAMDDFAAAYLRCDAALTLVPGPYDAARPNTLARYPASEVAAAIQRLRGLRGVSRRPPMSASPDAWDERRWRWSEDDRQIEVGMRVAPELLDTSGAPSDDPIWAGSPLVARCHAEDVAWLALTLARRFPALLVRLEDGRLCAPAEFIALIAEPTLAPALASGDPGVQARASEAQARYAALAALAPPPTDAAAAFAAAPFTVLSEDAWLLAVNKPSGVVTHPTYKHPDGTLTDAVFARAAARGEPRPWLLHRLDKETSGVVLFARRDAARRSVVGQFERHTTRKRYLALLHWPAALGTGPGEEGEIDAPLARDPLDRRRVVVAPDGQPARTRYRLLAVSAGYALALAEPVTGRTHQIRAHLAALGAPLVGDLTYRRADTPLAAAARAMLHAWRLDLHAPGGDGAPWSVVAQPPADFIASAEALGLGPALAATLAEDD